MGEQAYEFQNQGRIGYDKANYLNSRFYAR